MSKLLRIPLDDASIPWRSTRHPGITWFALGGGSEEGGDEASDEDEAIEKKEAVVLIRMSPGCGYPPHLHVGAEDVVILQGGYRDELGEHEAGTFLRYPAGSTHAPVATGDRSRPESAANPACILFAIAREGVRTL
jgi:anti-sigma factor ChrR (cupin superfamily)